MFGNTQSNIFKQTNVPAGGKKSYSFCFIFLTVSNAANTSADSYDTRVVSGPKITKSYAQIFFP